MKYIKKIIVNYALKLTLLGLYFFVFPVIVIYIKFSRGELIEKKWDSNLQSYWNRRNEMSSNKNWFIYRILQNLNYNRSFYKKLSNVFKKKHDEQEKDIYPMW